MSEILRTFAKNLERTIMIENGFIDTLLKENNSATLLDYLKSANSGHIDDKIFDVCKKYNDKLEIVMPFFYEFIEELEKIYDLYISKNKTLLVDYNINNGIIAMVAIWKDNCFRFIMRNLVKINDIRDVEFKYKVNEEYYYTQGNKLIKYEKNDFSIIDMIEENIIDAEERQVTYVADYCSSLYTYLIEQITFDELFRTHVKPLIK